MNIANIAVTISILKRANNFDLSTWQSTDGDNTKIVTSLEEASECGTSACIAGYTSLSEEFKAVGGGLYHDRTYPCIYADKGTYIGSAAMAYFWDAPLVLVSLICGVDYVWVEIPAEHGTRLFPHSIANMLQNKELSVPRSIYGSFPRKVMKEEAIQKLEELVAVGLFLEAATLQPFSFSFNGVLNNGVNYDAQECCDEYF